MKLGTGKVKMTSLRATAIILLTMTTTFSYAKTKHFFELQTVFFNSFEIKADNSMIEMTWVVTEYNNKNFFIQHSANGTDWEDVAIVPTKNSPESLVNYSFQFENKISGRHYYRLKTLDLDQKKIGYSPIKTVIVKNETTSVSIWPNPTSDVINIASNSKGIGQFVSGKIFDLSGRKVVDLKLEKSVTTINIAALPTGTYLLYLENGNGNPFNQKIIKQ